jgi:hypothetical protein
VTSSSEPTRPFAIFSDRSFSGSETTPHAAIFVPFWGTNPEAPGDPTNGRFDRYAEIGTRFLRLSTLPDCDVGVFPLSWESAEARAAELGRRFTSVCREAGKTPVVFHGHDSTDPIPFDGVVFRTSLLRSQRGPSDFAQPAWSEDLLARYLDGEVRVRLKQARPVVGFCGSTLATPPTPTFADRLRGLLGHDEPDATPALVGDHPRTHALLAVDRDRRLEANFILHRDFWAGAGDSASLAHARREFVQNLLASDYGLCVRGSGNFSFRFYETLCLGRIPVFVDTDCVLPLDFDIEWRDYCVWVDADDIDRIGDHVLEFHESLGDAEFEERQRACRRVWETQLSPEGFFASFHRHFEQAARL